MRANWGRQSMENGDIIRSFFLQLYDNMLYSLYWHWHERVLVVKCLIYKSFVMWFIPFSHRFCHFFMLYEEKQKKKSFEGSVVIFHAMSILLLWTVSVWHDLQIYKMLCFWFNENQLKLNTNVSLQSIVNRNVRGNV